MIDRDAILALSDDELAAQCDLSHTRGSGPGGQKRNKTSSAVRLTHRATGLAVRAEAERSQNDNRRAALKRLRWAVALAFRQTPTALRLRSVNARVPREAARVLDHLDAHAYSLRDTAAALGATTGALSGWIGSSEDVLTHVNESRKALGLRRLHVS